MDSQNHFRGRNCAAGIPRIGRLCFYGIKAHDRLPAERVGKQWLLVSRMRRTVGSCFSRASQRNDEIHGWERSSWKLASSLVRFESSPDLGDRRQARTSYVRAHYMFKVRLIFRTQHGVVFLCNMHLPAIYGNSLLLLPGAQPEIAWFSL